MNKKYLPRGTIKPLSNKEKSFWAKFPELLFDDIENEHNELITILRRKAFEYFKK